MKKVFYTMATWFKSMFSKKPAAIKVEETVEDKKQILRDFNKEKAANDYDMVLSQTVRASKPGKYANKKNVVFKTDKVEYSLTAKQDFFLNEIRLMQRENKDVSIKDVVQSFLEMKYINTTMNATEMELKPSYHKKTINYLVKCGAIKQTAKNYYRTTF
jgi:hypothetical protein